MEIETAVMEIATTDTATMIPSADDTKPINGLRKFPPEIREHIFIFTLADCWEGKTPALLKALYGDREVYMDAIKVFYKVNTFLSHKENDWGDHFEDHLLPTVTRWKIKIMSDDVHKPKYIPKNYVWRFAELCNLERVHFVCEEMFVLDEVWREIFQNPINLRRVEVTFDSFWLMLSQAGMDALDERFGVRAYHSTVGTYTHVTLFWEAPKGEVLNIHNPTLPLRPLLNLRPNFWELYLPAEIILVD